MIIPDRREFLHAADTYVRSRQPTPQIVLSLIQTFAQMLANDCGGTVAVILPGNIMVERKQKWQ